MIGSKNINGRVILVTKDVVYAFPFGYAYLASYLKQRGEEVEILYRPAKRNQYADFVKKIIDEKPLLVGFGTLYPDLYETKELIEIFNQEGRDFPLIIGGQMVTPTPEFALQITGADIGVIGEGEMILDNLVKALRSDTDIYQVKGLAINDNNQIEITGPGEYFTDMSLLPILQYDIIPPEKWLNIGQFFINYSQPHWLYNDKVLSIHGGRGCPFNCNFCYHHSVPRYRKVSDMFAGLADLISKYKINMLYFGDDLVLASPQRTGELIQAIKKLSRKVEFSVSCRFDILDRIDDKLLHEMKKNGCRIMSLGIESGSQRILDIIDKRITVEQIKKGLERLKNAGILPTVSVMIGQYTETLDDVQKSIDLMLCAVKQNKNIIFSSTFCTPFPGTGLYDLALKEGKIKNHKDFYDKFDPNKEMGSLSVNLSAMSDSEAKQARKNFDDIYKKAKDESMGFWVKSVEKTRYFVYRVYNKLNKIIFSKLPDKNYFNLLKIIFTGCHNFLQSLLDKIRLRLLGLK
jgi:radical SAM superfamily enzyme YgiQ (UPF0313 family)